MSKKVCIEIKQLLNKVIKLLSHGKTSPFYYNIFMVNIPYSQ